MASLTRISTGLTAEGAREVTTSASYYTGVFIDGLDDPIELTAEPGKSLLDHHLIAERVKRQEKRSLLEMKAKGLIVGPIRARESEHGLIEWDHWTISLTREETEMMMKDIPMQNRFHEAVRNSIVKHPEAHGIRMGVVTHIHKDTGNWHIQGVIHRHAIDYTTNPPTVSTSIDLNKNSVLSKLVQEIQRALDQAEVPVVIDQARPSTTARSVFEDRRISDDTKIRVAQQVLDQGGAPTPGLTIGPRPSAGLSAEPITPEAERIRAGIAIAERIALRESERAAKLRAEAEAAERLAAEETARIAAMQHALAAIEENTKLTDENNTLKTTIEEQNNTISKLHDDNKALTEENNKLTKDLQMAEAIRYKLEEYNERLITTIDEKDEEISGLKARLEQQDKAISGLRQDVEKLTKLLDEERNTFIERARKWAEENILPGFQNMINDLKREIEALKTNRNTANNTEQKISKKDIDKSFAEKSPDEWSEEEQRNAQALLSILRDENPNKYGNLSLYQFGEKLHREYLERQNNPEYKPKM